MNSHGNFSKVNCDYLFVKNPDRPHHKHNRYTLHHTFDKLPRLNATIAAAHTDADARIANEHFELLGSVVGGSISDDLVSFPGFRYAGIQVATKTSGSSAHRNSCAIVPHLDANSTAWSSITFGTDQELDWNCTIRTDDSIANMGFWAGLKLTPDATYETDGGIAPSLDSNSAYFVYSSDDTPFTAGSRPFANNNNLHFVYAISGTDYITDLEIEIEANKSYNLRIVINAEREVSILVAVDDDKAVLYPIGRVAYTAEADIQLSSTSHERSLPLAIVDLIPVVGIVSLDGQAIKKIGINHVDISRKTVGPNNARGA